MPPFERSTYGDYKFVDKYEGEEGEVVEEDYADIETMLMWDVRPEEILDDEETAEA